ncbi:hypothetical protein JTB14_016778 [Gonioctena quinquepunctata]|nr:hypothetical protein JTB14_016778 [Gonioctena quinquepunctata]
MITKSIIVLCSLAIAHSASIQQINIPVEVRYDEKLQITPEELQVAREETVKEEFAANAVKNLDAKVQLSPEELTQSLKHLPVLDSQGNYARDQENYLEKLVEESEATNNDNSLPQKEPELLKPEEILLETPEAPKPQEDSQELLKPEEILQETPEAPKPQEDSQELPGVAIKKAPIAPVESRLQYLRDLVFKELRNLRNGFKPSEGQLAPKPEEWEDLEKSVNQLYEGEKNKILAKQTQLPEAIGGESSSTQAPAQGGGGGIFQGFFNGMYGVMNDWVQNIQGARPPSTQGDEGAQQPSNPIQAFFGYFQQGASNIMNIINNAGQGGSTTQNTVLGDTGAQTPASGNPVSSFFGGVVTNVQNFFNGGSGGSQGGPGTQGDTGENPSGTTNQQGPGALFFQTIGSAINNVFQGNRPQGSSGDEGTQPAGGTGGSGGNFITNINNAIQNSPLNIFRPPNGGGTTGQNPIQTGIQSAGNQIQQVVSQIQGQTGTDSASGSGTAPVSNTGTAPVSNTGTSSTPEAVKPSPIVETPEGQTKTVADNTIETSKPEKTVVKKIEKEEQKQEILATVE